MPTYSTFTEDDLWNQDIYGGVVGTQTLGDMYRIVAQKFSRLRGFYAALLSDYQARYAAGNYDCVPGH